MILGPGLSLVDFDKNQLPLQSNESNAVKNHDLINN